jgi:YhcH/YjgK/YiaL family protein
MIIDSIARHNLYPLGPAWTAAFEFLRTLSAATADGHYPVLGERLYVGVNSYTTRPRNAARLETHRTFVDVQLLLSGREVIEVFPKEGLVVSEPYQPEKDVEFYQPPMAAPVRVALEPGTFVVFFPSDAG